MPEDHSFEVLDALLRGRPCPLQEGKIGDLQPVAAVFGSEIAFAEERFGDDDTVFVGLFCPYGGIAVGLVSGG